MNRLEPTEEQRDVVTTASGAYVIGITRTCQYRLALNADASREAILTLPVDLTSWDLMRITGLLNALKIPEDVL